MKIGRHTIRRDKYTTVSWWTPLTVSHLFGNGCFLINGEKIKWNQVYLISDFLENNAKGILSIDESTRFYGGLYEFTLDAETLIDHILIGCYSFARAWNSSSRKLGYGFVTTPNIYKLAFPEKTH